MKYKDSIAMLQMLDLDWDRNRVKLICLMHTIRSVHISINSSELPEEGEVSAS